MQERKTGPGLKRAVLFLAILATVYWLSTHRTASDWRYPRMLISQIPKMPFRYFV